MPPKKGPKKPPPEPATGTSKSNKGKDAPSSSSNGSGKNSSPAPPAPENKPPSVQETIGGKSWTGKLPQTLFYEHCVRTGWGKPNYDMRKEGNRGFVATVYVTLQNPKTKEIETVNFRPQDELEPHQPTALEARHYCATYALHRVSNMKNIHMMLPPTFRSHWAKFEEVRKAEVKTGKAWKYEADPFAAKRERAVVQEKIKARLPTSGANDTNSNGKPGGSVVSNDPREGSRMKGWQRVPVVDMSQQRRKEVESLIRKYHAWNPQGVQMQAAERKNVVSALTELGFRKAHVEEAIDWVKDKEEAFEWLLIHVPEDDLPSRFLPENYSSGISFLGTDGLRVEYAVKRLAAAGYSLELCREVMERNCYDEDRAAEALMQMLVFGEQKSPVGAYEVNLIIFNPPDPDPESDQWEEEQESLEAIFDTRYKKVSPTMSRISLEVPNLELYKIALEVRKPTKFDGAKWYPDTLPTISVVCDADKKLPAYVRLSIIRRVAGFAEGLLGEQMVFNLVDWLESNIAGIVEDPGRLRDLATAVTGSDERNDPPIPKRGRKGHRGGKKQPIDWTPGSEASLELIRKMRHRLDSPEQMKMMAARQNLPAWKQRDAIVAAVREAQVTIVSGETGSGKSTQSVQFILDDLINRELGSVANIICTQPRRISALGLADRVSDERCSEVGQEIGYAIRGESRQTPGVTKVTFVTTGVLLRRLQMGDTLADVSHIVVDEVHERSLDTDFLLILLKRILARRDDLRVVLMSATLDADVFSNYFGGRDVVRRINISGRTFPVTDLYLDDVIRETRFDGGGRLVPTKEVDWEDLDGVEPNIGAVIRGIGDRINYNLVAATVLHIDQKLGEKAGGILIFLPGTMEIQRCLDAVKTLPGGNTRYHALPLHASLLPAEQRRVFPPAPKGQRKVIAATNVAETSITIEDIVAVIDTGRVKETSYDPQANVVKLAETWVSRAAAKQRRGRAGRVRAGFCYKLFTRNAEANKMPERPEPELKRVPLEQTCLGVKAMGVTDVRAFLASALSPPDSMAVEGALDVLDKMGAVADDELTSLGRHMAMIPADLRCSKLMVFGALFGVLDSAVTIAATLTNKSPFVSPMEKRQEAKTARTKFARNAQGDLLADVGAYEEWAAFRKNKTPVRELRVWCGENYLSHQTLLDIASNRSQYLDALRDIGFLPFGGSNSHSVPAYLNRNRNNDVLLRALIAGAFTPQIARIAMPEQKFLSSSTGAVAVDPEARTIKYFTNDSGRVFIHPSSTVFEAQAFPNEAAFMAFFSKVDTSGKIYLRECSPVSKYGVLLFGGKVEVDTLGRGITVDQWVRLRGWGRIGMLVKRIRGMLDDVLGRMVERSGGLEGGGADEEVVRMVVGLVEGDGK